MFSHMQKDALDFPDSGAESGLWQGSSSSPGIKSFILRNPTKQTYQHFPKEQFPPNGCSRRPLNHPRTSELEEIRSGILLALLTPCRSFCPASAPGGVVTPIAQMGLFLEIQGPQASTRWPRLDLGSQDPGTRTASGWKILTNSSVFSHIFPPSKFFHSFSPVLCSLPQAIWFQEETSPHDLDISQLAQNNLEVKANWKGALLVYPTPQLIAEPDWGSREETWKLRKTTQLDFSYFIWCMVLFHSVFTL